MKNYYEILEVNKNASKEMIETAYKILSKKYQVDQYVGEERVIVEEKLKDMSEAYKILTDEFLREQYNLELEKELSTKRTYPKTQFTKSRSKKENKDTQSFKRKNNQEEIKTKEGTFTSIEGILKNIFRKRNINFNARNLKREDYMAAGITLIIVVGIAALIWFVPPIKNFIKSLLSFK